MNTFKKYIYASILILLLPINLILMGQNSNDALRLTIPGIISNARSLGMGNTYVTQGNDYTAILYNPAGLALAEKSQLSGGLYYRYFENTSTFFGNTNYLKKLENIIWLLLTKRLG